MRRGPPRLGAADEQVQWTCESVERPERKRRAGELFAKNSFSSVGSRGAGPGSRKSAGFRPKTLMTEIALSL